MDLTKPMTSPEIWAGLECTINRVGDRYFDQMALTGHDARPEDLDRLAALGVRTVRYPVLWERHAAEPTDWSWADARLGRLRSLGIRPIVGLVHHGSGPPHTSLIETSFADGLAAFAGRVAARYPWVDHYTPVNEPLTTARFSALYGHWYPHTRKDVAFARAFLNQCRAVVLSMRAIRLVRPDAVLVQTEDLGQTHSTSLLKNQADFENHRRWLTWDLLCGRVDRRHPLWDYLNWAGLAPSEVEWFLENSCPPNLLGVNHYVTSERFLDHRVELYPERFGHQNHEHSYIDTEAVRVVEDGMVGPANLLAQAWARYARPLAVTEVHLGCSREEQLRWFWEVWQASCEARAAGADVQAVTAWSVFGSYDWDSLVTQSAGHYEPGVFDVRAVPPRPTAVAGLIRDLGEGRRPNHPVLDVPGWWHRPERLRVPDPRTVSRVVPSEARQILITGATGTLGRAFARICRWRGLPCVLLTRQELDIADPQSVSEALGQYHPWAVVNAAGYVRVDDAEAEPDRCRRENVTGPAVLASACRARGVRLVTFSSDLVFNGQADRPYRESDPVAPLSMYGLSKAEAEHEVLARDPDALVIRTSAFFGPWDENNFVFHALDTLRRGVNFLAADDLTMTPSYVPDLVHASLDLLIDGGVGVWHLSNPDPITWADLAREVARLAKLNPEAVNGCPAAELGWSAPRPTYSALASDRGPHLPPLAESLTRYFSEFNLAAF